MEDQTLGVAPYPRCVAWNHRPVILRSTAACWAFIKNGQRILFISEDRDAFVFERLNLLYGPFIQVRMHLAVVGDIYPKRADLMNV